MRIGILGTGMVCRALCTVLLIVSLGCVATTLGALAKFSDRWSPKVIAEMNDYQFKLAKVQGDFVWHDHKDTDEAFIVLDGQLRIEFRDGAIELSAGEMFVVPKGVEHRPFAEHECHLLLVEPRGVINTGDVGGDMTVDSDVWV